MQVMGNVAQLLTHALTQAGATSELGGKILDLLQKVNKIAPPGSSSPAGQKNVMDQAQLRNAQQNQMAQQMRQRMMQGGGGGAAVPAAATLMERALPQSRQRLLFYPMSIRKPYPLRNMPGIAYQRKYGTSVSFPSIRFTRRFVAASRLTVLCDRILIPARSAQRERLERCELAA